MLKTTNYDDSVQLLFKNARSRKYPKNQIICYQGDKLTEIYQIKSGHIKAYTILDSGDNRTLFLLTKCDIFPIAFSLTLDWDQHQLRYFYQSMTNVEVDILDHSAFKQMIEDDPKKMTAYLSYMSASNQAIMSQLEVMKNKKAINKVAMLLPYLVDKLGEEIAPNKYRLDLKLSHQEIADLSGVTRETTTTLIKELKKQGVLEQKRAGWVVTIDPDAEEEHFIG